MNLITTKKVLDIPIASIMLMLLRGGMVDLFLSLKFHSSGDRAATRLSHRVAFCHLRNYCQEVLSSFNSKYPLKDSKIAHLQIISYEPTHVPLFSFHVFFLKSLRQEKPRLYGCLRIFFLKLALCHLLRRGSIYAFRRIGTHYHVLIKTFS